MKLWLKIYLFSLLLLILTLNIAGFLLIQNFHNSLLKKEIEKCITEEKFLAFELKINSSNTSLNLDFQRSLNTLMNNYTNSIHYEGTFQILDMKNNIIYTDFNFPISKQKKELVSLYSNETRYLIRPLNQHYYLYVCRLANVYDTSVKLYYANDISSIYAQRQDHYTFFMKLDLFICLTFAAFMFFISRLITKPIDTLIASAQKIALGKYSERALIHSKDEFNTLSKHFNLMAQTIEDKISELERSNEEKETFINNFTHELKTPLTSIIGYSDFIRSSKYNEELFFEAADYIYKESKNLEQIAFKMMDLIYSKSQSITFAPINIMCLFEAVKKSLQSKLESKQIDLYLTGSPILLMLDETLMKILLCNLLDNAIKASPNHSKIIMTVSTSREQTTLSIRDFGIGIAPEHLDKLCEPFYIVDPARTKKNNGAGIGLSICKKIAEAHHAVLYIESQLGKGTTVSLTFPEPFDPMQVK